MTQAIKVMKSLRKFLHKKTPVVGLKKIKLFIICVFVFASIGGYVAYAVIVTKNNEEQNTNTTIKPTPAPTNKVNTNTPATANNNTPTSDSSQSAETTQSSSTPAPSSDPPYNPYDTNGSPKDIYGCVLPPTDVSNLQLYGIYQTAYAGCISMTKPSWCFAQASNAYSTYSNAILPAQVTYSNAKVQDEAYIQKGQALGGMAGQQMVSAGNSALVNDQATYRTAYNAAYDTYSNAIRSSNQQGNCNNSIPTYQAPAY